MAHSPFLLPLMGALLCATSITPRAARAEEPSSADRATARTLAQEGYEALKAQQYATAADRFGRANALVRAPTLLRDLARAQIGLGKLVDAHETYSQIIREGVPAGSPASWERAVEDAKTELAALAPRLPWMTITVAGPAHPRVTIDGAPIAESSLGVKRPADPGRHELRALGSGYYPARKTVVLKEGETVNVSFALEEAPPDAPPKDEAEAGRVRVSATPPALAKEPGWRKPVTISAFALGGAGLVVGSVAGILAMNKHDQLTKECPDGTCGPGQESALSEFRTMGTVSTLSFVAAGVGLGAGVVLLLVKPKPVRQEPVPELGRVSWSPFVSVGAAGVKGSF